MGEKSDIESRQDLDLLLRSFYENVFRDELIRHFFIEVKRVDLDTHLPRITDFWETVLLNGNAYQGNAIAPHMEINRLSAMEDRHFQRWLLLFGKTIDALFEGEIAERAKQRAASIATLMRIKIANASGIKIKP